jgi:hypothetical protein
VNEQNLLWLHKRALKPVNDNHKIYVHKRGVRNFYEAHRSGGEHKTAERYN